jgi:co-chaperonin GroES (HSP10)|tara:strand:- start:1199 stop:1489 length:291 start_codon:yes stop_codon:yes gene_type:complete
MQFKPMNRHLLIEFLDEPEEAEENDLGIVLPETYKPKQEQYISVRLLGFASDCNSLGDLVENSTFLVEASMINELKFKDNTYQVILENYVLGKIRD